METPEIPQTAPSEAELKASIFLHVAIPLLEEVIKTMPKAAATVRKWNCVVQVHVLGKDTPSCHLVFSNGTLTVNRGKHPNPTLALGFRSFEHLVATFTTGAMFPMPKITGWWHVLLLMKTQNLLNSLKLLLPDKEARTLEERALKVTLLLYMVSGALQEMSGGRDEFITRVAMGSKGKVAAWSVLPDGPNAYIVLDEGKITAHRGVSKKRPFATTEFIDMDAAYEILTGKTDLIQALTRRITATKGSPEYAGKVAMLMKRVDYFMNPPAEAAAAPVETPKEGESAAGSGQ